VHFERVIGPLEERCHSEFTARRLDEMYKQIKEELMAGLNSFKSKYSITCDV
jgi:hypothetical protein